MRAGFSSITPNPGFLVHIQGVKRGHILQTLLLWDAPFHAGFSRCVIKKTTWFYWTKAAKRMSQEDGGRDRRIYGLEREEKKDGPRRTFIALPEIFQHGRGRLSPPCCWLPKAVASPGQDWKKPSYTYLLSKTGKHVCLKTVTLKI